MQTTGVQMALSNEQRLLCNGVYFSWRVSNLRINGKSNEGENRDGSI